MFIVIDICYKKSLFTALLEAVESYSHHGQSLSKNHWQLTAIAMNASEYPGRLTTVLELVASCEIPPLCINNHLIVFYAIISFKANNVDFRIVSEFLRTFRLCIKQIY